MKTYRNELLKFNRDLKWERMGIGKEINVNISIVGWGPNNAI